ncbi:type IV secretion system protein VirB10 [Sphingomonas sp. PAMC 26605]|uniref:type IV secretion system protein VirB10 n=1 Tax=Sphingomonas sp. PAMC 26605 TaxID=1112214 RepID=UPI00026CD220|nr:type IV secretion system protein VirB10 [Sphingomonas sp. PAMC 26605]
MSSIPPVGEGSAEITAPIVRDRTPEREEVERTITPVGGGRFGGNRTGAIVGVAAVVAALFFINVGSGKHDSTIRTVSMTPDANVRPDQHAAQTQQFDAGAGQPGGPPNLAGTATGRMATMPDGTVVPAITPGAVPAGSEHVADGHTSGESLADKSRRAPLLISVGGTGGQGGLEASAPQPNDAPDARPATQAPAGELDHLRQVSAIGSSHAAMLPNRNYLVTAGTMIPCILQTAMNSTQPGYTSCIIPRDVFSDNGRVVLMEKGTKVLGQYQGGISQGQNRIFVLWTRAVTPRGVAVDLASPASDALGRAGMAGAVDTFFWARFGAALMLSLVDDASSVASSHFAGQGTNTTQVPSSTASVALQNTINIKPVLKKNQGEEVGIFVAQDFNFADVYSLELRR